MQNIKVTVNFEESILQIKDLNGDKLLFQINIQPESFPSVKSDDLKVEFIPEQFQADEY